MDAGGAHNFFCISQKKLIVIQLSPFKQELKMTVNVYTLISLGFVTSTPIIDPYQSQRNQFGSGLPKGFCFLPSELGQGKAVLVEDCNNLGEENCGNCFYDLIQYFPNRHI